MENPQQKSQSQREKIEQGLRSCPMFHDWPADRLWELSLSARLARYRRDTQILVCEGTPRDILLVVSGSVELGATNATGDKYLLAVLEPGQVVQLAHLLMEQEDVPSPYVYHARKDSQIIHIPSAAMRRLLDAEPTLWRSVALLVLRRHRLSTRSLKDRAIRSIRRRLAIALMNLAKDYDSRETDVYRTELHISQTDLANMLKVSRQTVGKELRRLQDEGGVNRSGGYNRISLNIPGLKRIVQEDECAE
ncbi:Crp/Fnr family transcriptional regulator [Burkholderia guangdongensis]|uniref:Crp/Fnr family transcriptional regulator n=1 Tax=Burkholderia guangdongensis TaxID=1792500 RepID=UPI0015C9B247|nr:Crp/Fnr family transcriptional regulator [Burkholderia guangdongensis]